MRESPPHCFTACAMRRRARTRHNVRGTGSRRRHDWCEFILLDRNKDLTRTFSSAWFSAILSVVSVCSVVNNLG